MDYDDLAVKLRAILAECTFVLRNVNSTTKLVANDDLVKNFQSREGFSSNIKSWKDLTVSERKFLMDYLSNWQRDSDEKALAVDLILYTMGAPGYEKLTKPADVDDMWGGYCADSEEAGYVSAFSSLKKNVNEEYERDPNAEDKNGWTKLMEAIRVKDNGKVQMLLSKADVNAETKATYSLNTDGTGFVQDLNGATLTPLIVAVQMGNVDAVRMLLAAGADVYLKDSKKQNALDWVEQGINNAKNETVKNNLLSIKSMLESKAKGGDAFLDAINDSDLERVNALIKAKADVNGTIKCRVKNDKFVASENGEETTPLIIAARYANPAMVRALIAAGADVNKTDTHGHTALYYINAKLNSSETSSELLMELTQIKNLLENAPKSSPAPEPEPPVDVNAQVESFLQAIKEGKTQEALRILEVHKKNSAFLNWKDKQNRPLWGYVLKAKNVDVAKAFLQTEADLNVKDPFGATPMHVALGFDGKDVLPILLEKQFDINAKDNNGQTPLHWIGRETSAETIEAFITSGAQVNATDNDKYTPLDLVYKQVNELVAAEGGISKENIDKYKSYIEVLLKHGARSSKVQLSEQAKVALNLDQEPKAPTVEEFFTELRKDKVNSQVVKDLLRRGANAYINEFDLKEGVPTSGMTPVAIAVMRCDVELLRTLIAAKADVNKPSKNEQTPLALALQQLQEANQSGDKERIKVAEEIVKALREAGAKDKEEPTVEVDTLARQEGEALSDWYKRVATYWSGEEAKVRKQLEAEQEEAKKKELTEKATAQHKLAETYSRLHALETSLASETDPEKKKKLLAELTQLSGQLMQGIPAYYGMCHKDALTDLNNPLTIQRNSQQTQLLKASGEYQKALNALNNARGPQDREGPTPDDTRRDGGGSGGHQPEVNVGKVPEVDKPTDPTAVTPALVDSVAKAKHDGAQEKSWWERNQEWIWWVLGIIVVAVLGYFGFRKGGWFNKDKKKTTTTSNSNSNENSNSNTNTDNNNTNTDNNNTNTNTGSTNDTLANSGKLYSTQEVNSAIAANLQNIINRE